jgi:hypothetical protein
MIDKKKKNERQYQWDKQNTMFIGVKLQKTTDSDIIEYMENKPKQTTIKKALRLLIKSEMENS